MARLARSLRQGEYHLLSHANRWTKSGVWNRVLEKLKAQTDAPPEKQMLDSTSIKVHPAGTSALREGAPSIRKSSEGWTTKIPMLAAKERTGGSSSLSLGNGHDAPAGEKTPSQDRKSSGQSSVC